MQAKDLLNIELVNKVNGYVKVPKISDRASKDWLKGYGPKGKKPKPPKSNRKYENRIPVQYKVYIKSHWWKKRKAKLFSKYGKKCTICGHTKVIQVHHKYYGDYGNENDSDLVILCMFHHGQLHEAIGKTQRDMRKVTNELLQEMKNAPKLEEPFLDF